MLDNTFFELYNRIAGLYIFKGSGERV